MLEFHREPFFDKEKHRTIWLKKMTLNTQAFQDRIKAKVDPVLIDLLTQEEWEELVSTQILKFVNDTAPKMIEQMLIDDMKERIVTILASERYAGQWDNMVGRNVSDNVKSLIQGAAPEIFSAMLEPVMMGVINDLKTRLATNY